MTILLLAIRQNKLFLIPFVLLIMFGMGFGQHSLVGFLNARIVKHCDSSACDILKARFPNYYQLESNLKEGEINYLQGNQIWIYGQAPQSEGQVEILMVQPSQSQKLERLALDAQGRFYTLLDLPATKQNFILQLQSQTQSKNYRIQIIDAPGNLPKLVSFCKQKISQAQIQNSYSQPLHCKREELQIQLASGNSDYFEVFWNSVLYGSLALNDISDQRLLIKAPQSVSQQLDASSTHKVTILPKDFVQLYEPSPEVIYYNLVE